MSMVGSVGEINARTTNVSVQVLPFRHPSTILVAGPTGCGKTHFLLKMLTTPKAIGREPQRIVWIYSEWQAAYENLRDALGHRIQFIKD